MKEVEATIEGLSPLLMHAFPMTPIEAMEKKPVEDQAELAAYRIPGNGSQRNLCIPGVALQRALVSGATYSKGKGRGNLSRNAAACLLVAPEYLDLGVAAYSIDTRPVVIPATKGRILRHRPRLNAWRVSFTLEWDEVLLTKEQVRKIVDETGSRVGVLDFRPEKKARTAGSAWCRGRFGARQGVAGLARARQGAARLGLARLGRARHGMARLGDPERGTL